MDHERHLADVELVARARAGDVRAQQEIFQRIGGRIRAAARHLSPDPHQAEDAAQDVVVQILSSLGRYRGQGSLEAWADGIAVRALRKRFRTYKRRQREVAGDWELPSFGASPEQEAERRELAGRLAALVARLPDILAEALVLRLVLGYSVPEAARLARVRENTFRDRLRRARALFRELVQQEPGLVGYLSAREEGGHDRV